MKWWLENNLRMIQNNLRDIDASMDVDLWFEEIKKSHCNCVMVGAGGISSFFPSKLPYQTPSPYLNGDTLGKIVEICHKNGVKVIARFDFSKTHVRLLSEYPDWYYVSEDGFHLHYNDTAATCVCGEYQQEKSLEIIREVLTRYEMDGIFFNMFGFQTKDYSNIEHGICNCPACKKAYFDFSGKELPKGQSYKTDATYSAFKEYTVSNLLNKIQNFVREISPDTAVCTYHHQGVDIIRDESNSAVDRPLPFFLYSSSDNCQTASYSWQGEKTMANVAINAVDIFYRFQGVSEVLTKLRLYGNIASGSQLDYCIIGDFKDYPDKCGVEAMREVFKFHEKNEKYFGHLKSEARVLLYRPDKNNMEYRGLFVMLKELHIPFDVLDHPAALLNPKKVGDHDILIIPAKDLAPKEMIEEARKRKMKILYTAVTNDSNKKLLEELKLSYKETLTNTRAAYLYTKEKDVFDSFADRDWVILDKEFGVFEKGQETLGVLPLISSTMFGPPERCFGHEETTISSIFISEDEMTAAVTFKLGTLYRDYGYTDHKKIFFDLLKKLCPSVLDIKTNLPASVETFIHKVPSGETMVQLLNYSGYGPAGMENPIVIHDAFITLPGKYEKLTVLTSEDDILPEPQKLSYDEETDETTIKLSPLGLYRAIVLNRDGGVYNFDQEIG